MNAKYSFSRYVIATLAAAAVLVLPTACKDDLGYQGIEGQQIAFKLTAPDAWHDGMPINENAPTTHCTSVRALSGGDTKLYLHTVVADNPAEEKAVESRGTLVTGKDADEAAAAFKKTYFRFSLSGVYTNTNASLQNAYDLHYESATGTPMNSGKQLLWSSNSGIEVYAFAPTIEDFNDNLQSNADDSSTGTPTDNNASLELNKTDSPTLTYTVPKDVTKQVDLMTAHTSISSAPTQPVGLQFEHALTAVQIKCGKNMLAGKITEVTIAGIYGKGTWKIESSSDSDSDSEKKKKEWNIEKQETFTYTISKEITLSPSTEESVADKIHVPENTPIAGTDTDNLTFMLLPQTLPEGATMTIKFTDDATQTERTLTGSLAGQTWEAGKIVTYSVSPSSIHISAKVEFENKTTATAIPYSGVWYDATYTAKAEVVQGDDRKTIEDIQVSKFQYSFDNTKWEDCTTDANGLLTIAAQPAYTTMSNGFSKDLAGSEDSPFSLSGEYGETANCYLVDKAGYYSLPLVYGNGYLTLPIDNPDGFIYFPKHDDKAIPADGKIAGAEDAVLCWQDAPDLIDPASVKVVGKDLVFRIRKQTLMQGNALLAVRNADKEILWSWHIWVTPYKNKFYSEFYNSVTTAKPAGYEMAKYNLGWCDKHEHNNSRTFSLQAIIDMSAYGGATETVNLGTFTQMEFKGSDAGDNTYYQWGRKDPMLGGIYNANTPNYKYMKKNGTDKQKLDTDEFTMENKQVFNQYNQDGYNYSFCKNPGDKVAPNDEASNGVSIGYAIKHPYMFVTNSRCSDSSLETTDFNYRNHWHKPYKHYHAPYLHDDSHILFNAWDAGATQAGVTSANITKSVYDPCPPQFKVPPLDAFQGIVDKKSFGSLSGNAWTLASDGQSITFPITGVRNYALRSNEWTTVEPVNADPKFSYEEFYKISMPAFKSLTYISSATIERKEVNGTTDTYNAYQVRLFRFQNNDINTTPSSNSYGLSVRPIKDNNSTAQP